MTKTKMTPGESAARYAKKHDVTLADAARRFGVSRERARQKWRDLFGDEPTPLHKARSRRDAEVADLADLGFSAAEIACQIGCVVETVRGVRDRSGLAMVDGNEKRRIAEETKKKIVDLARNGKGRAEIAHATGVNYRVVSKYLEGHSTRGRYGSRGRSAQASAVMDATGCSVTEAAAKFVVAPSSVWIYRKRRGLPTTQRPRSA